jgi:hypothetical protein
MRTPWSPYWIPRIRIRVAQCITAKDFDGWIEERGSKFLAHWDKHYEPLLETHDAGQDPQKAA